VAGSCEHENEPPGSIKGGAWLDQVSDYQLLMAYSIDLIRLITFIRDIFLYGEYLT